MTELTVLGVSGWIRREGQWRPVRIAAVTIEPVDENPDRPLFLDTLDDVDLAIDTTVGLAPIPTRPGPDDPGDAAADAPSVGARHVAAALEEFWPGALTRTQTAQQSSMTAASEAFNRYLHEAVDAGWVEARPDGTFAVTFAGRELGPAPPPDLDTVRATLKAGAVRLLDVVQDAGRGGIAVEDAAKAAGLSPSSVRVYLTPLRRARAVASIDGVLYLGALETDS